MPSWDTAEEAARLAVNSNSCVAAAAVIAAANYDVQVAADVNTVDDIERDVDNHNDNAASDVVNRKNEGPTTPTPPPAAPPTPSPPPPPQFRVGDNVNAKYKRGEWLLAHVTAYDEGKYTVYFLHDGKEKRLDPSEVRVSKSSYPLRTSMLGKDFFFGGAPDLPEGLWRVRQILHDSNMYKCTRLTGAGLQNVEEFDIGYVIKQYVLGVHDRRSSGVGEVIGRRTRRQEGTVRYFP